MIHNMSVKEPYFHMLKEGIKTVELRLFDEKRQKINVCDTIVFSSVENPNEKFEVTVVGLYRAETFETLCEMIEPTQAGFLTEGQLLDALEEFYPIEKQKQYSVLGIKVNGVKV